MQYLYFFIGKLLKLKAEKCCNRGSNSVGLQMYVFVVVVVDLWDFVLTYIFEDMFFISVKNAYIKVSLKSSFQMFYIVHIFNTNVKRLLRNIVHVILFHCLCVMKSKVVFSIIYWNHHGNDIEQFSFMFLLLCPTGNHI